MRDLHQWHTIGSPAFGLRSRWTARFTPTNTRSLLPPAPPFCHGRRAPLARWPLLAWSRQCKASWIAQKRPRDPTSPRAPLGGTYMWPHTSETGHVPQLARCVSLVPCNYERDLSPSAPRKNSRLPRPPSLFTPAADRHTDKPRQVPRWRWPAFASASSTATVSCRRRSLRRRCGPREVVALEPFDGMPLRGWG